VVYFSTRKWYTFQLIYTAIDNIFIERFWRSLKYDYVYLNPANDGLELYQGLKKYISYYNYELHHQGIGRRIPAELYKKAA